MRKNQKGSMTIFLALLMGIFLSFFLVLIEGTRLFFLRVEAAQAVELAEFSVLSEFQQELFSEYGIFALDLDYEQGNEQTGILEQRIQKYLSVNMEETVSENIEMYHFRRLTDQGGAPFFEQAVEEQKIRSGQKIFEEIFEHLEAVEMETVNLSDMLRNHCQEAESIRDGYKKEDGTFLFEFMLPQITFPSVPALTEAVFGNIEDLSKAEIPLEERLLQRDLVQGVCNESEKSFAEKKLFFDYLFEHFAYYGTQNLQIWREALSYQMEYIIAGNSSDRKNLETILWKLFLLRAGGNYVFYHQDTKELAQAEAEAMALVGITGNTVLIEAVREIFLISKAIENGISETRRIFAGEKVPLYKNGLIEEVELGYEEYLRLFLMTTEKTKMIYRCMDLIELEVRAHAGYPSFRLDHCTDQFEFCWSYQVESLFYEGFLSDKSGYQRKMERKVFYEK